MSLDTVSRAFDVEAPPGVVQPYLSDFANAEQWDPGTVRCVRNGDAPIEVGTSWSNSSKIGGISTDLTYTLERLAADQLVFVGRNDTATSTETIDITPNGSGSHIVYTNELHFNGAAKLAAPAFKLLFEKLGNDTERQLTEVLNGLAR